ncbi:HlyD family secretion protein [Marinicella rhabdoformis]|uniref:HlyD family secretion protein n=1 Tax=Marinicella rhabdoformis TaxID=2580566 RepID=UPI0012AECB00|nr:HlyD family efflux transporter periplasmic adaptor subunit [Marinicella rhabdoformis]
MKKIMFLGLLVSSCCQSGLLVTGVVESSETQHVVMPLVRSFQGKVSELVEEGSFVKPGDFVARIDGSELDSTIESKKEQLDVFEASSDRDVIQLKIELNNADLAYEKAIVDKKVAELKAQVPVNFIGELEYKERQLTLKKANKTLADNRNKLQALKKEMVEKKEEIVLGMKQKKDELDYWKNRLAGLTINAEQSGYVIYSSHPWTGSKYQAGDQVQTGMEVLKISKKEGMKVKAWINAIDVENITLNQEVMVKFDALPNVSSDGKINMISSGGHDKKDWGNGLYYEIDIELLDADDLPLLPGMSAQVAITDEVKS